MKRIALPLLALLLATSALAQMEGHDHAAMMANHDRMFADAMSMHHEDGIRMAQMAVEKAQDAELRAMAQTMVDDQRREIDQMQALRPEGSKMSMDAMKDIPGMMPMEEMRRDMARLESATGRDFDIAFTEIMPKHHDGAIVMSKHEIRNGKLEGMKDIARGIAEKQARERDRMLAMHAAWTGDQATRRRMTKD